MVCANFISVVRTERLCLLGSCGTDRIDVPFHLPFQNDDDDDVNVDVDGRGTFGAALLVDNLQVFA